MEKPKQLSKPAAALKKFMNRENKENQSFFGTSKFSLFFINRNTNREFNFTENVDVLRKVVKLNEMMG